ncbi:MAG: methyltransferase domain-containing protein [Sphingobium sp.]|nr:methyltransferase domain-containing protein [Sphingobium sp.]MCP5397874.1 methyltransferase domain-containing protein [Sphingomonas sp.]
MQPIIINAGCGPTGPDRLPQMFASWRHVRVDVDPEVRPDVVADITDLSPFNDNFADALWTAHCVEHLYQHQVVSALQGFLRILKPEGYAIVTVPDVQTIAKYVVEDKLHETIYDSPAGPISAHDVIFGHSRSVEQGNLHMAHRTAFTPSSLIDALQTAGFADFVISRRPNFELVAIGRKTPWPDTHQRQALLNALML